MPEELLTVDEVAKEFKVARAWVYAKSSSGELPRLKLGRYVRFRRSQIEDYLSRAGGDARH